MNFTKNADAFGKLAGICAGLEGRYNPAHPNLLHSALVTQLAGARASMETVNIAERTLKRLRFQRDTRFAELARIASRLRVALLREPGMGDARIPLLKLSGSYRPPMAPKPAGDGTDAAKAKASHGTGAVSRIAQLERVIAILRQYPSFVPPAPDLSADALTERLREAHALNEAIVAAGIALGKARETRTQAFANRENGLVQTGIDVRRWIRAQFGLQSPEARSLRGLAVR